MDRIILHVDCNSFFAAVETVFRPELAKVPMAVAGDAEARRGIILAKNELAKRYGIQTAETIWSAKKKCPGLVLVPPHYSAYAQYSGRMRQILSAYTDMVEPFGMDEAWLDVTGSRALFGDGATIAERIRLEVKETLGITVSVGVSFNKVFAKLGSDYKKPDAVTVIMREDVARMIYPLPVGAMLYVGKQTEKALEGYHIRTIGDLAACPSFVANKFGKLGTMLVRYARGEDDSPVANAQDKTDAKSISNGMTFRHDLVKKEEIALALQVLSEEVAYRLRKSDMQCTTVSVTVKDFLLKSTSKQTTLSRPCNIGKELGKVAYDLALQLTVGNKAVRMLSVCATGLVRRENAVSQIGLFDAEKDEKRERLSRLETTVDSIRDRFGMHALKIGGVLNNDIGIESERQGAKTDDDSSDLI